MQLFIRGLEGCTATIDASEITNGEDLKEAVEEIEGLEEGEIRLLFGGKPVEDDDLLEDLGIGDESTIDVVLSLLGGGKKRKKKVYTTPKKIKKKPKKVKLPVLKYYKVDDSGKITRLRKECESESCGAGIFMANHKDRYYCGKCALTYVIDTSK
ncbi:uncharacterized protein LOC142346273 [Convolutriloba macropyga]|uniref:uncharacterized protein LOC142346273 n=1 Tax=Convolutriloba macropyga TaxID=536237 RepID=UPI003F51FC6A